MAYNAKLSDLKWDIRKYYHSSTVKGIRVNPEDILVVLKSGEKHRWTLGCTGWRCFVLQK